MCVASITAYPIEFAQVDGETCSLWTAESELNPRITRRTSQYVDSYNNSESKLIDIAWTLTSEGCEHDGDLYPDTDKITWRGCDDSGRAGDWALVLDGTDVAEELSIVSVIMTILCCMCCCGGCYAYKKYKED